MNDRFPILSFVSICLKILGWLFVIFGLLYAVATGLIEPNKRGHSFGPEDIIDIASGLGILIFGLITAAFGEIIGVLFAIEDNTRRTYNAVAKTTQNNSKKHHPYNEKSEAQLKIEAEKQAALEKQRLLRAKKDYQQGKCPECGEKIDKELIKCYACGSYLPSFE